MPHRSIVILTARLEYINGLVPKIVNDESYQDFRAT